MFRYIIGDNDENDNKFGLLMKENTHGYNETEEEMKNSSKKFGVS